MAGKLNTKINVVVACLVALIQISSSLAASSPHTVGGSIGWINSGVNYTTWANSETFAIGDTLVFNFVTGGHTVTEVSKSDYESCTSTSPISTETTSPATITLTAGSHYYICTVRGHCNAGQKLAVTAGSSSSSTESPPPPLSSAVVAGAGLLMPFLIGAAAFFL